MTRCTGETLTCSDRMPWGLSLRVSGGVDPAMRSDEAPWGWGLRTPPGETWHMEETVV